MLTGQITGCGKKSVGTSKTTTGAEAHLIQSDSRGPEGQLFHSGGMIRKFFRNLK